MSDPSSETAAAQLVERLESARDAAAALAGTAPLGVRAIEPAPGRRGYVAAFEGPRFLCLDGALAAERSLRRARETASAGLLWEHAEAMVDPDALRELARAIGRLLALGDDPAGILPPLETVAARAIELAAWRDAPLRAIASLEELERGAALQERLNGAWRRFVRASEPLVERQDALDPVTVEALRDIEQAAGAAGAAERLADRLAAAMPDCEEGAEQMVAVHVTRLREP